MQFSILSGAEACLGTITIKPFKHVLEKFALPLVWASVLKAMTELRFDQTGLFFRERNVRKSSRVN